VDTAAASSCVAADSDDNGAGPDGGIVGTTVAQLAVDTAAISSTLASAPAGRGRPIPRPVLRADRDRRAALVWSRSVT
jgi:hypothetical protein